MLRINRVKVGVIIITLSVIQGLSLLTANGENSPQAGLIDWSQKVEKAMSIKMERKTQQIVLEAQKIQKIEQDSRPLITSVDNETGRKPVSSPDTI